MKLSLTLSTEESIALRRFANEVGEELDVAVRLALQEFLMSVGHLEYRHALDEDTETKGEA